jgi:hypothetical protein
MAVGLASIRMPPSSPVVKKTKKCLVDILTLKNQEVYDDSIGKIISSCALIDTQALYGARMHVN